MKIKDEDIIATLTADGIPLERWVAVGSHLVGYFDDNGRLMTNIIEDDDFALAASLLLQRRGQINRSEAGAAMKTLRCRVRLAGLLIFVCGFAAIGAHSAPADDPYYLPSAGLCFEPKCWQSIFDSLRDLPPPQTQPQREHRFADYYLLAKSAYLAGDFEDSAHLFDELAPMLKGSGFDQLYGPALVAYDAAQAYLATKAYAKALGRLDEVSATLGALAGPDTPKPWPDIGLLRATALFGLGRSLEADALLEKLPDEFDYDGWVPEVIGLGQPVPLNPYIAARWIASYYLAEGKPQRALDVILEADAKLVQTWSKSPEHPGVRWADVIDRHELLCDKGILYFMLGDGVRAESSLKAALDSRRENAPSQKRPLLWLAALERQGHHVDEAREYAERAAAVPVSTRDRPTAPLAGAPALDSLLPRG